MWHAQLSQWGCDHCRQMLATPVMAQPQVAPMPGPPCPRCSTAGVWYAQAGSWGCDRCQAPIGPPMPMAMPAQGSGAGMIILKVVLVIVLVIVIAAIKLGIRGAFR
ncbi:MAG: hypothetical protein H6Q90_4288 [Deltaproteobacteria bacterium]|nr:hypothetical protein [Deltaproteobacteria bacterium]